MTATEKINKLVESFEAARKQLAADGNVLLKDVLAEFFAANPTVAGLRWRQYTPYFNDGDPCTFSTTADYADVILTKESDAEPSEDNDEDEDEDEYDDEGLRENEILCEEGVYGLPEGSGLKVPVEALLKTLGKIPDEIYEGLFGDGMRVTARRDGTFETEEYSHD